MESRINSDEKKSPETYTLSTKEENKNWLQVIDEFIESLIKDKRGLT
jgi:hypothetical protein